MLVTYPDDKLYEKSISAIDNLTIDERKDLSVEMRKACGEVNGFGISAIQIGQPYQILGFVSPEKKDLVWMCDPVIEWMSEIHTSFSEGCLSIPGYFWEISRPDYIKVSFKDINGNPNQKTFSGSDSRIIQHEMDHLDGLLIVDFLEEQDFILFYNHYKKQSHIEEYISPTLTII